MAYVLDLHRPVAGDVIELILADHRLFEELLRALRDSSSDRDAVRTALATVLVAHAEAEEKFVYPKLRKRGAVGEHEAEHGEEEHAEGHEALLKVLELKGTDTQAFTDAVEELSGTINHHVAEEELTILNPARDEVGPQVRAALGQEFLEERQRQIDANCGTLTNVRELVARARRQGKLDDDD
jgi:hemerythrin superfamily protein